MKSLDALRLKLAEASERSTRVALHQQDWWSLGVQPHMPPEMTAVRLDVLQAELQAAATAMLDASLAAECLRADLALPTSGDS